MIAQRADRGSASVWVLVGCALVGFAALAVLVRTEAVFARHRAETAADLAALSAAGRIGTAGSGCASAARLAALNSARLVLCEMTLDAAGRSGTVRVRVAARVHLPLVGDRTVLASARAARGPAPPVASN